jgi:DNA-binding HxlR family transcriptional regulator
MFTYGHYCPVAKSAEILGDRWTVMIVREFIFDLHGFNEIYRSLPGISRSVLSDRLKRLEEAGAIERRGGPRARASYYLTPAGEELREVIGVLGNWAARWVLTDPTPRESDPDLVMMGISRHLCLDRLPSERVVLRFDVRPPSHLGRQRRSYWFVLEHGAASLCRKPPGFEDDLVVRTDAVSLFKIYMGRMTLDGAMREGLVTMEGLRKWQRGFRDWMGWSSFAEIHRASMKAGRVT